jgi:Asp-tRNA(Asn)/Glu-tRNA(Gln) amidotransferase A subunit family amidase
VEEARPDFDRDALAQATRIIIGANVRVVLDAGAKARGRPLEAADVERVTWEFAALGGAHTAADYARSIGVVHRTGRAVGRFFTRHDIILSPTMCRPPFPLGVLDMTSANADAYLAAVLASIGFTALFNSSGNPAMSVPLAWSRSGLPIGVQFAAPFGGEALLFRLAGQLEAAQPWAARRPANLPT